MTIMSDNDGTCKKSYNTRQSQQTSEQVGQVGVKQDKAKLLDRIQAAEQKPSEEVAKAETK